VTNLKVRSESSKNRQEIYMVGILILCFRSASTKRNTRCLLLKLSPSRRILSMSRTKFSVPSICWSHWAKRASAGIWARRLSRHAMTLW
jgi:hypothetical protein